MFILLFLFIIQSSSLVGKNFIDDFVRFDSELWEKDSHYIYCAGPCVWADPELVRLIWRPAIGKVPPLQELQILMREGCETRNCCGEDIYPCPIYSAGQITSAHAYTYGSFKFSGTVTGNAPGYPEEGVHDAWTCFCVGSKSRQFQDDMVGFSMCVSSTSPWVVVCSVFNHNETVMHEIQLPFNAAKHIAWFRMDWRPNSIAFFVNKRKLKTVSDLTIQDRDLYIKVQIMPHDEVRKSAADGEAKVEFKAHLHRITYRRFPIHVDLFSIPDVNGSGYDLTRILLLVCLICLCISFLAFILTRRGVFISGDLLEVEGCYVALDNKMESRSDTLISKNLTFKV